MEKSLLFDSSVIFDQSNLIDHIRQSLIEVENEIPEEDKVQQLFNETLIYLDKDILTDDAAEELFLLILSCLKHYTTKLLPLFNQIYETSTKNAYHIIITTSTLFYLTQYVQPNPIKIDYQPLITDFLNQIVPQIQKINENSIILFDHEISPQFRTDLILNLLLLTTLTEDLVSGFSVYLLSHNLFTKNEKMDLLLEKVAERHFIFDVPLEILPEVASKMNFSIESVTKFAPLLSEGLFKFVFPQIEKTIQNSKDLSKTFSIALLHKCSEFDITIKPNHKLIEKLSVSDLTPQIIEYLRRYDDRDLEEKFTEKLYEIPCLENFPEDDMNRILLDTKDLQFYLAFFPSIKKFHPVLSSPSLWTNIVSIASTSKEDIPREMVEQFRLYFQRFVKMSLFEEVFTAMTFSVVPQTSRGMYFVVQLVKNPKSKIKKNFFRDKNMQKFILKVRETKIIPKSCFWELFSRSLVFSEYMKDKSPLFLYGYLFASGGFEQDFDKITILGQNEESIRDVYEFISNDKAQFDGKYELKENMSEAAISLIACALLFARFEGMIPVEGITEEIFLPFLAISFDFLDTLYAKVEDRNDVLVEIMSNFKASEPFTVLKKALKMLENNSSPVLTASIDRLLPYLYTMFSPEHFSFHVDLTVLQMYVPFLLTDKYKANNMILLSTIFQFSNGEHELNKTKPSEGRDPVCLDLLLIFRDNFDELFKFIIAHLDEICKDEKMKKAPLNLAIFGESIPSLIVNTIQNSSSNHEAVLFINFIENFCTNTPKLQFPNSDKLEEILQETIKDEKKSEASLVYQFMLKNGFGIDLHHLIANPPLLSYLQPLTNHYLLEIIFNNLMKEETTATKYIEILLQKVNRSNSTNYLTAEAIFKNYSKEIQTYENDFVKVVQSMYAFDKMHERFIVRPEVECLNDSVSNVGLSAISNLFDSLNEIKSQNNSFIILKSIASSFPFLFENKSLQIFNAVLPALSNFILIFDEDDENDKEQKEMKIQTALSSLSFLHSTLFSPKVLDDFVIWLFNNIKTFTESQTLSFLIILRSLMNINYIRNTLVSQMIKFNFIEVVKNVFQRDLNEGSFRDYFLSVVYNLTESFYCSLKNLTPKDEILIDELMKVENPFQLSLDRDSAIFPGQQESSLHLQLERTDEFVNEIETVKPFWFTFDFSQRKEMENKSFILSSFLSKLTDQSSEVEGPSSLVKIPIHLTNPMLHYLATKPSWISKWIEDRKDFILLQKHNKILGETSSDLKHIQIENQPDPELYNLLDLYRENGLFEKLIEQATSPIGDQAFPTLCSLINEIVQKDVGLISLLKCVNEILGRISINLKSIQRIVAILMKISDTKGFKYDFIDTCGNNLLNSVLIPEFREHPTLLADVSTLFSLIYGKQPNRIVHLVDFMLLQNDPQITHKALVLSTKMEKENQDLLMPIITNLFDKFLFTKGQMKYNELSLILKTFPDIAAERKDSLLKLLDNLLEEFNFEIQKFHKDESIANQNKDQMLDLIGTLFDILAPKRGKLKIDDMILSPESHFIPQSVRKTDPDFWRVFSRHYPKVIQELYQDPALLGTTVKFLLDYPELIEFNIRYAYFNEIKKKLSKEEDRTLYMTRVSILNDSMVQLYNLPPDDFLRTFQVQFVGERMKSQIGDFYRSLVKELFHPKNYYFIYTETKKSFQINPRSSMKNQHLDFFKFAGKIIARAMLENESLNIHLTSSLYKILLQLPLELGDLKEIDRELYNTLQKKLSEDFSKANPKDSKNDDDDGMLFTLNLMGDDEEEEEEESKENEEFPASPIKTNQIYVDSKVDHRLKGQIIDQVKAFTDGFYSIIPLEQIKIFTPNELDLLVCGMPMIDVSDLKKNVEFEFPYTDETPSVKLFFSAIEKWDQEKLSKLVLFITRSSQSIVSGFRSLKENGNPIKIAPLRDADVPQSFPLINMLLLPEFDDEDFMNYRFYVAFTDSGASLIPPRNKRSRNKRPRNKE